MAEVVVFGVVAVDVVIKVPTIPRPGEHVAGEPLGWRVGGSSANLACALSSAGHSVRLVGPVGSDPVGDELIAELVRWGVDTGYLFRPPEPSPRTLVLLDDEGERTIIGLRRAKEPSEFLPSAPPDLATADCVFVESYTRYPLSIAEAAPSALLVVSPPVPGATSWPADIVVGSVEQYDAQRLADPFRSVRSLAGPRLRWVVITRGAEGADAYGDGVDLHVPAKPVRQVDSTGAGDAFTAGLLHGLLQGDDFSAALDLATTWGAAAVEELRSLPPAWEDLLGR